MPAQAVRLSRRQGPVLQAEARATDAMRLSWILALTLTLCFCSGHTATSGATSAGTFDDFAGPAGSPPNPDIWDYDPGNPNPGNQTYTSSTDNARLDGEGHLLIQAVKSGNSYTSGRLVTRGKVDMLYGRVSARIKMPSGQGVWPAFWMLGSDYANVGWPECGEIDLMELVNSGTSVLRDVARAAGRIRLLKWRGSPHKWSHR